MAEKSRILVVDDDEPKRYVVARMLRAAGYDVAEAGTGAEALSLSSELRPELLVLDVKLPDIDGMEVARRIKADPALRGVLVLQLSAAFKDPSSRSRGLDAGADSFLAHPVENEELLATVRALLRIARSERATAEANARLRLAEEQLRLALEATETGIWDRDMKTGRVALSAEARRVIMLDEEASNHVDDLMPLILAEDVPVVQQALERATLAGGDHKLHMEFRVRRGDGEVIWVETRGHLTLDGDGKPERFLGSVIDITARKAREAQMERWTEFQQIMLGVVGHDLRNPLTAIITTAAVQLRRPHDEGVKRAFVRINSSAQRATRIVNGLLDYTRARLGAGIPVERQDVDLARLLRAIVDEVNAAFPERSVVLQLPDGGLSGRWDPDRLDQVFMNLIQNALQYSEEGSPVRVSARAEPERVVVAVHNRGPVIPEKLLPTLFEPFKRGSESAKGLGLGLYIVNQIVRAHGGEVKVTSTESAGTAFTVTLPRVT